MNWPIAKLGDIAEFINGAAFRPEDWGDEGLKIIRIQNLTDKTKPFNRTKRDVDKRLYIKKGDILVSWSATLGVFIWEDEEVGLLNQHIFKVEPNLKIVDKNYLEKALVGALVKMNKHLHGATMKHVNRGEFLATEILLPPIEEQQRIAAILDKVKLVKCKRELAVKKLEKFAQSQFVKMFNEIKDYQTCKLKDLCKLITKGTTPTTLGLSFEEYGIPFIRAQNIVDGKISFSKDALYISPETHNILSRSKIYPNDVVISIAGTIGRSGVVGNEFEELNCNQAVAILRVNARLLPNFLRIWLESDFAKKQILSSTVTGVISNLSLTQIGNLEINLPKLEIQKKFLVFIDAIDKIMGIAYPNLDKLEKLEASLANTFLKTGNE